MRLLCSFYKWSDLTQLTSNVEVRNLNSNEVTRRVNQMESYLIQVQTSHFDLSYARSRHSTRRMVLICVYQLYETNVCFVSHSSRYKLLINLEKIGANVRREPTSIMESIGK